MNTQFFLSATTRLTAAALLLAGSIITSSASGAQELVAGSKEGGTQAAPVAATTAALSASTVDIANGAQTRSWLSQQGSRQQASKTRQTMSGPVMDKVYQRYVNSFEAPIRDSVRDTSSVSNR